MFQNATDLILAPSDGPALSDNPPEPLPEKEQKAVYKRLEAIERAQQRQEEPTKSEQYADACKLVAEYRGISIEQLFKQEPERYEQYRRLVLEE